MRPLWPTLDRKSTYPAVQFSRATSVCEGVAKSGVLPEYSGVLASSSALVKPAMLIRLPFVAFHYWMLDAGLRINPQFAWRNRREIRYFYPRRANNCSQIEQARRLPIWPILIYKKC